MKEQEIKLEDKVDEIINYQSSLLTNNNYFQEQVKLSQTVSGVFYELLKMGRKTISEYNNQIAETFKTQIEYQTNSNNMYLLKLNIDSILFKNP